jgi:hypothetical protein
MRSLTHVCWHRRWLRESVAYISELDRSQTTEAETHERLPSGKGANGVAAERSRVVAESKATKISALHKGCEERDVPCQGRTGLATETSKAWCDEGKGERLTTPFSPL